MGQDALSYGTGHMRIWDRTSELMEQDTSGDGTGCITLWKRTHEDMDRTYEVMGHNK